MLDHIVINHPESCMDIGTEIIISDINQPMLDVGKSKAERIKIEEGIFLQNLAFSHLWFVFYVLYVLYIYIWYIWYAYQLTVYNRLIHGIN